MSTVQKFDWHLTRFGGILAVRLFKVWASIARKPHYSVNLSKSIDPSEPTIIVSNHQQRVDPPAVFSALKLGQLIQTSPVKFMTWHKYYNTIYKPFLYLTGCYPSHGDGLTGVEAAVHYAKTGYRSFIFPEGKRTKIEQRGPAYSGVVEILRQLPNARVILIFIQWEERRSLFSRPKLEVIMQDAPKSLNRNDPNAIMDAVYALK